jgi:hypothetical protein
MTWCRESFVLLCYDISLKDCSPYAYSCVSDNLKLRFILMWRFVETWLIWKVYNLFIICLSLLETAGVRISVRNIRNFNNFSISLSRDKFPSVRCVLTSNEISNVDIFDDHFLNINFLASLVNRYLPYLVTFKTLQSYTCPVYIKERKTMYLHTSMYSSYIFVLLLFTSYLCDCADSVCGWVNTQN